MSEPLENTSEVQTPKAAELADQIDRFLKHNDGVPYGLQGPLALAGEKLRELDAGLGRCEECGRIVRNPTTVCVDCRLDAWEDA